MCSFVEAIFSNEFDSNDVILGRSNESWHTAVEGGTISTEEAREKKSESTETKEKKTWTVLTNCGRGGSVCPLRFASASLGVQTL